MLERSCCVFQAPYFDTTARLTIVYCKQLGKFTFLFEIWKVSSADGDEKADDRTGSGMKPGSQISEQEKYWRTEANDYEARFCGHCNTTTDIKEANFFGRCVSLHLNCQYFYMTSLDGLFAGFCVRYNLSFFSSNGQYIVAGSDDGSFFIWERKTSNIVRVLRGDDSIVNCLQPHPTHCLLATSGIDPVVRLWSPRPEVKRNHIFNISKTV